MQTVPEVQTALIRVVLTYACKRAAKSMNLTGYKVIYQVNVTYIANVTNVTR